MIIEVKAIEFTFGQRWHPWLYRVRKAFDERAKA
jgi:hypothetical protein